MCDVCVCVCMSVVYLCIYVTYSFPAVIVGQATEIQLCETTPTCTLTWLKNDKPGERDKRRDTRRGK